MIAIYVNGYSSPTKQVEHYANANGLRIIGYYEANEKDLDDALSLVGQKVASKILESNPEAYAVVVSQKALKQWRNSHFTWSKMLLEQAA